MLTERIRSGVRDARSSARRVGGGPARTIHREGDVTGCAERPRARRRLSASERRRGVAGELLARGRARCSTPTPRTPSRRCWSTPRHGRGGVGGALDVGGRRGTGPPGTMRPPTRRPFLVGRTRRRERELREESSDIRSGRSTNPPHAEFESVPGGGVRSGFSRRERRGLGGGTCVSRKFAGRSPPACVGRLSVTVTAPGCSRPDAMPASRTMAHSAPIRARCNRESIRIESRRFAAPAASSGRIADRAP
jgi:hypothetical protein